MTMSINDKEAEKMVFQIEEQIRLHVINCQSCAKKYREIFSCHAKRDFNLDIV